MLNAFLAILPYAVAAAAAAPIVAVVTSIILTKGTRPIVGGSLFTAGAATLDIVVAIVVLVALWGNDGSAVAGDASAYVDVGLGVLFLVLGVVALFGKDSAEADAKRRGRVDAAASAPLGRLFSIGILAQILNIDALTMFAAGLKEIPGEGITPGQAAVVVGAALVIVLIPYYGPIVPFAISREKALRLLGRLTEWLLANNKPIEVVVGIGFGLVFLVKGSRVLA